MKDLEGEGIKDLKDLKILKGLKALKDLIDLKYLIEVIQKANSIHWLFFFLVLVAEFIFTYWNISIGVIIYLLILISLLIITRFKYKESAPSLYLALTLIPLIRIISVSIPMQGIPEVFGFVVVSLPLFIAGAMVAKMVGLTYAALGFRFYRFHIQLLIALLGLPLGFVEFFIVQPEITNIAVASDEILMWVIVLIICVGLLEEFIFRGILFNVAIKVLGSENAIYFTSLSYAALNISGRSFLNVIYTFLVSILFCRLFVWQKSLLGLSLAHGLINVTLYIICPLFFS